jgi:hypothetical protein
VKLIGESCLWDSHVAAGDTQFGPRAGRHCCHLAVNRALTVSGLPFLSPPHRIIILYIYIFFFCKRNACCCSVQNLLSYRLSKNVKIRIFETIILHVVLYGSETWSLILREEHKLRVFENRVLRIFGPKKDRVMGGWRKLHNKELHNLYPSPSIIRTIKLRMRWVGHVVRMGEKRNVCRLLVGRPELKRPLGRPRRRWIDKIRVDLLEIGLSVVDLIGLAQDRYRWRALVIAVKNLQVT